MPILSFLLQKIRILSKCLFPTSTRKWHPTPADKSENKLAHSNFCINYRKSLNYYYNEISTFNQTNNQLSEQTTIATQRLQFKFSLTAYEIFLNKARQSILAVLWSGPTLGAFSLRVGNNFRPYFSEVWNPESNRIVYDPPCTGRSSQQVY